MKAGKFSSQTKPDYTRWVGIGQTNSLNGSVQLRWDDELKNMSRKFREGLLEELAAIECEYKQLDGIPQGLDAARETA